MSGYNDIEVFSPTSKILSISAQYYWVLYAIPGAAGRTSHVTLAAQGPGPADGSRLLVLDPLGRSVLLRDCPAALFCWSSAAFCCCSGQTLVWTAGRSRWAVLISSYRYTSDLVMIQMMSCFQLVVGILLKLC
jgi:hypothetical protein